MATTPIPSCDCIRAYSQADKLAFMYCLLVSSNAFLETLAGGSSADQYASTFLNATGNGSIPAGVLGWSITAVSGTVTVQGQALPNGGTTSGGGYGGKTTSAAIAYTVAAGVALVNYDSPS